MKKLTRTRIVLAKICDPKDPLLPEHEISIDGPMKDARMVHFLAATLVGLLEMKEGRFKSAEPFFGDALTYARELQAGTSNETSVSSASIAALRLTRMVATAAIKAKMPVISVCQSQSTFKTPA